MFERAEYMSYVYNETVYLIYDGRYSITTATAATASVAHALIHLILQFSMLETIYDIAVVREHGHSRMF